MVIKMQFLSFIQLRPFSSQIFRVTILQSFFIGGGTHPASVLAGFDHTTLSTALNVSIQMNLPFLTTFISGKKTRYNLYNRKPDFKNEYGWRKNVDESDYSPLQISGNGVYLVNLSSGSMMAPHVNPRAIEYGVVLKGTGRIQIVYPNGTLAMNARVREGDIFWVPRYFPFCQIASTNGNFEFFGFTTSARRNHQQFLVGKNSLMQRLRGLEFAAAFGLERKGLKGLLMLNMNKYTVGPNTTTLYTVGLGETPPSVLSVVTGPIQGIQQLHFWLLIYEDNF
nr:vicilin-like seed storage protein At2g28490 [Solanum lycopersicum]